MKGFRNALTYNPLISITLIFLISKACQFLIFYSLHKLGNHYDCVFDKSNDLMFMEIEHLTGIQLVQDTILGKFIVYLSSWDTHHYIKNIILNVTGSTKNKLYSENSMVFSPHIWCKFISCLLTLTPSSYWLSTIFYINILICYLQAVAFYLLMSKCVVCVEDALIGTVMFIFNISGIFQTTFYAENLSVLSIFTALCLRAYSFRSKVWFIWYALTLPLFTLSVLNRPNCLLVGLVYEYDLMQYIYLRKLLKALIILFLGITMGITASYFLIVAPEQMFCHSSDFSWCVHSRVYSLNLYGVNIGIRFPIFYSYLQAKYWNIGLFKYYTFNNIPNFLLALPQTVLIVAAVLHGNNKITDRSLIIPMKLVAVGLLVTLYTVAHVQIINRISNIVSPLLINYIMEILKYQQKSSGIEKLIVKMYLLFNLIYFVVQAYLFLCFLPPA